MYGRLVGLVLLIVLIVCPANVQADELFKRSPSERRQQASRLSRSRSTSGSANSGSYYPAASVDSRKSKGRSPLPSVVGGGYTPSENDSDVGSSVSQRGSSQHRAAARSGRAGGSQTTQAGRSGYERLSRAPSKREQESEFAFSSQASGPSEMGSRYSLMSQQQRSQGYGASQASRSMAPASQASRSMAPSSVKGRAPVVAKDDSYCSAGCTRYPSPPGVSCSDPAYWFCGSSKKAEQ